MSSGEKYISGKTVKIQGILIPDHEFQRAQRKGFRSKESQRWAQKRALGLGDERFLGSPGFPVTKSEGRML